MCRPLCVSVPGGDVVKERGCGAGYAGNAGGFFRFYHSAAGCGAADRIAVNIARAFGRREISALRAVVAVGGVVFVAGVFQGVDGEAVCDAAVVFFFAAGIVVVERVVDFVSVVGEVGFVFQIGIKPCALVH